MKNFYSLNGLCYKINEKLVIKNVSCKIKYNTITRIKGLNGAGKTTLLKLIYGLYKPSSGKIIRHFDNNKIRMSYLFQNSILLNRSIKDNLNHALYCQDVDRTKWDNIIIDTARKFDLEHLLTLNIKSLSGGEFQMLMILRSILNSPNLLFLDEPTNNLDLHNIKIIANIIKSIHINSGTILLVSHDKNLLDNIEYDQISLNEGKIIND